MSSKASGVLLGPAAQVCNIYTSYVNLIRLQTALDMKQVGTT